MSAAWPKVKLGEVLKRSQESADLMLDSVYKEITVRLWGKGVALRGVVAGSEVASQKRYVARKYNFILSRIDARNGALGLVPDDLDGAIVTNDFPVYGIDQNRLFPSYIGWMCKTVGFREECQHVSEGTTNRVRLKEEKFLRLEIPLPPLSEQERIVLRIEELAGQINHARALASEIESDSHALLNTAFDGIIKNVRRLPMSEAAPLVRRPVKVEHGKDYHELGVRSFGKGSFHKPALTGLEIGNKRLYRIEPGDLVFNNVFAWEAAVAVAKPEDAGRFGSHRFITCVPEKDVVTAEFLCFYFLTPEGLQKLGEASPGGAGRNRTLGLEALSRIEVPVPAYKSQLWFNSLQSEVNALKHVHAENTPELDALLPSILDKAFKGEL